ncbi:CGNR zinc finger domain-containing protein [Streptomyces ambofaciens]
MIQGTSTISAMRPPGLPPTLIRPRTSAPSPPSDSPTSSAPVDTSRNGRRAYCSVRCANNDAVARPRARLQASARPTTGRRGRADSGLR